MSHQVIKARAKRRPEWISKQTKIREKNAARLPPVLVLTVGNGARVHLPPALVRSKSDLG
jgi:hypothetical protein